jgi:exodeoxyribonuclease VII small subunit
MSNLDEKNPGLGKVTFEASLDQLQKAVKKLEGGELSLEDSLRQFEEGVRLTRVCQEYLSTAEQRVEILMKASEGQVEVLPFTSGRP